MTKPNHTIQSQRFGVEIELTSITRRQAAEAAQSVVGGSVRWLKFPRCFDPVVVIDEKQREWRLQADSSLSDVPFDSRIELITPILSWQDLPVLQECIRAIRRAGAYASPNSSVHLHVSAEPHTPQTIRNLVKSFNRLEHLIYRAVGVQESRLKKYCRPNEEEFVRKLSSMRNLTDRSLNRAWFGTYNPQPAHYDQSRYRSLNLASLWRTQTIEFRFGEVYPKIHAGKIKAFIVLCLALSANALNRYGTTYRRKKDDGNLRYSWRVAMLGLNLSGPEYANVRKHLLANMPGNSAWKNPKKANKGNNDESAD